MLPDELTSERLDEGLAGMVDELGRIRLEMLALEVGYRDKLSELHETNRASAANLLHYLALRRHDLRKTQESLAALGLSSLGRSESHAMFTVDALLKILARLTGNPEALPGGGAAAVGFKEGRRLLERHTEALLGPKPHRRHVRVMVTMPSEAADDYGLVHSLLIDGMDCMRINCAHDDQAAWDRMITNLRLAREKTGRQCCVLMDLPGPKLRTGPLRRAGRIVRLRPRRDAYGRVTQPARIWLTPTNETADPPPAVATLPLSREWLASVTKGDIIKFFDARGASRSMTVVEEVAASRWAESRQSAYVTTGTVLQVVRDGALVRSAMGEGRVSELPSAGESLVLRRGDTLILTRGLTPGSPATFDNEGRLLNPATLGITLPEMFDHVREGESIWLDDGKIGGRIRSAGSDYINIEITHARPRGEKLRADKGINLPDSNLRLPALTEKDIENLPFIAANADLVGYSFVRSEEDVYALQSHP